MIQLTIFKTFSIGCENDAKTCSGLSWENCSTIGDNLCDVNSNFNSEECGFDGGDCQPNICFSTSDNNDCLVPDNVPCYWYKDGHCDTYLNKSQCCFDGGDCGVANSNTELCDATVNEDYCFITFEECVNNPAYTLGLLSCEELDTCFTPPWTSCSTIGDGQCDLSLNTKECYFDGGDCQPMETRRAARRERAKREDSEASWEDPPDRELEQQRRREAALASAAADQAQQALVRERKRAAAAAKQCASSYGDEQRQSAVDGGNEALGQTGQVRWN